MLSHFSSFSYRPAPTKPGGLGYHHAADVFMNVNELQKVATRIGHKFDSGMVNVIVISGQPGEENIVGIHVNCNEIAYVKSNTKTVEQLVIDAEKIAVNT